MLQHLQKRKFNVRRVDSQAQAFPVKAPTMGVEARVQRVFELLGKMEKKARPRKRKGLLAHVANHFKGAPATDIEAAVEQLFADGRVSESNGALVYKF